MVEKSFITTTYHNHPVRPVVEVTPFSPWIQHLHETLWGRKVTKVLFLFLADYRNIQALLLAVYTSNYKLQT